jgi:hypothetical protein
LEGVGVGATVLAAEFLDREVITLLVILNILLVVVGLILVVSQLLEVDFQNSGRFEVQSLLLRTVINNDVLYFSERVFGFDPCAEEDERKDDARPAQCRYDQLEG